VFVEADRGAFSGAAVQSAPFLCVTPGETPSPVALVFVAEFFFLRRVVTFLGAVAHSGELGSGEELELPHDKHYPAPRTASAND